LFNPIEEMKRPSIMRPDQVRGVFGSSVTGQADRYFYIVDTHGTTDYVWQVDGFKREDPVTKEPFWLLNMICPTCDRSITLNSKKKAVEIGDDYIEAEQFRCTWEGDFGQAQCTFTAGIVRPRERVIVTDEGPLQIDGMFKRA